MATKKTKKISLKEKKYKVLRDFFYKGEKYEKGSIVSFSEKDAKTIGSLIKKA